MSIKALIQIIILFLIVGILGGMYFEYFSNKKDIIEESNSLELENLEQIKQLEKKISDLENKSKEQDFEIENNKENLALKNENIILDNNTNNKNRSSQIIDNDNIKINDEKNNDSFEKNISKTEIKNLVKDVEYTSVDQKGNKFHLLANSGRSNKKNNDILDLDNVRGKISSEERDTIYIISDFAQYNTTNLNSKFYKNVIIDYQDKKITCLNFDINMETSKAIAYNNVIIKDPKSVMKAGIVEFDLKTKDVIINPESTSSDVSVITN